MTRRRASAPVESLCHGFQAQQDEHPILARAVGGSSPLESTMTRSGRNGVLRALDARDAGFDSRGLDLTAPNRRPAARAANDEATPGVAELTGSFLQARKARTDLTRRGRFDSDHLRKRHRGPAARTAGPYPACPGSSPGGGSECWLSFGDRDALDERFERRITNPLDPARLRAGVLDASQCQGPGRSPRPPAGFDSSAVSCHLDRVCAGQLIWR